MRCLEYESPLNGMRMAAPSMESRGEMDALLVRLETSTMSSHGLTHELIALIQRSRGCAHMALASSDYLDPLR